MSNGQLPPKIHTYSKSVLSGILGMNLPTAEGFLISLGLLRHLYARKEIVEVLSAQTFGLRNR